MKKLLAITSTPHPRWLTLGISLGIAFALSLATGFVTHQDALAAFKDGWEEG